MKRLLFALTFLGSIYSFAQEDWTIEQCIMYANTNNLTVQQNKINEELFNKDKELMYNVVTDGFWLCGHQFYNWNV